MSTSIHIRYGLGVTRYVGPGSMPGPSRIRLRIDDRTGSVYGITADEAMLIASALVELVVRPLISAEGVQDHGGTDKSPT